MDTSRTVEAVQTRWAAIRVAQLVETSGSVRRRIWASLPLRIRLADFLSRIAVSTAESFGTTVYGIFLQRGVEGMPPIKGQPAEEFDVRRINRLPSGYGGDFGRKAYKMLMSRFHDVALVEDVMMSFALELTEKSRQWIRPGSSLRSAENYVLRGLTTRGLNVRRNRKREEFLEPESETGAPDEEAVSLQIKRELPKLRSKLDRIHPDASQYVWLSVVEGYTDREIIGDPAHGTPSMLDHPVGTRGNPLTLNTWNPYKAKIYDVLKPHFSEAIAV